MLEQSAVSPPLNAVQLMLLRLCSRPVSTQDMDAIQNILLDCYNNALQKEVDRVMYSTRDGGGFLRTRRVKKIPSSGTFTPSLLVIGA